MVSTADGRRLVALAALLVLVGSAGCSGILGLDGDGSAPTTTPSATPSVATATAGTPSPSGPGTETGTATPPSTDTATPDAVDPDNPFGERTLTVAVSDPQADRDFRPIVRRALDYWEEHSSAHAGYPVEFRLVNRSADPRIHISFTDGSIPCDSAVDARHTGCAPLNVRSASETSEVTIATGYSDRYTYETVVHELGHTLGIRHGEPPEAFMAAIHPTALQSDPVRVFVTAEDGHLSQLEHAEVDQALSYYENHPRLDASERLDWVEVDSLGEADFVVEAADGDECVDAGAGSCSTDARYEDQVKVVLDNLDPDVYAWHTAALLAPAFFEDEEIPEELTAEATRDERERWHG